MSLNNQISAEIPADVLQAVTASLQQCKTLLAPYLQGLTDKERKDLFKMGDKTVATVSKVTSYISTNPEFIPGYMNTAEFNKDEQVVAQLSPVSNMLNQLAADVSDTVMLAGSEALMAALLYYGSVKEAAGKGVATAKPVYEDLKARFAKRSSRKEMPDTASPQL